MALLLDVVRHLLPGPVVARARRVRRYQRHVAYFLRRELASAVPLAAPGLVLRGFQSDRRWLYPTRPSRAAGYMSDLDYWRLSGRINPPEVQRVFLDKAAFDRALHEHGLGTRPRSCSPR